MVNERLVYACRGLDVLPNTPAAAVASSAAAEAAAYDAAVLAGYDVSLSSYVRKALIS